MRDVAIIGGGPAGAWAATRLAAAGVRVALFDGSHPREKPCGGGVTGRALALVGGGAGLADGVPVATAAFSHAGRSARVALDSGATGGSLVVVPRRDFDASLLAGAERAGADIVRERVIDVRREAGCWRVVTRSLEADAGWVIGADGAGSLVRRRVSRAFERADLSVASGYYVHGATASRIDIEFIDEPSGYLWSFPRPDHLAVGTCAEADEATSREILAITARWIDQHVEGGRRQQYSWPIPSLRRTTLERERPAGDGWMLVGDAAGLVDPITREGIFFALRSGELAADAIVRGGDAADAYTAAVRREIISELVLAARIKARFYRPHFMALLISALQRSERIRGVMADLVAGEQPYHTLKGRLLRTFELRLMLDLFIGSRNSRRGRGR